MARVRYISLNQQVFDTFARILCLLLHAGICTDFTKNWLAEILIEKKSDCLLLPFVVVVVTFYPPSFAITTYPDYIHEGKKC